MENSEITQKKEERNSTVDSMKGLLIILVVLGHTYNPICRDFIYLFHVGVFFIISGYCFNQKYTNDYLGMKKLLIKRIKGLWIPYVTYNFVFLLLQNIFFKIGFLTTNEMYFDYNPMLSDGFSKPLTIQTAGFAFIKSLFFINSRPFAGALWFLGGLFYVTLGYAIIQFFLNKLHLNNYHIIISIIMLVVGWALIETEIYTKIPMAKQVCIILVTEFLFTIGTYIREYLTSLKLSKNIYFIGLLYFALLTYYISRYDSLSIAMLHIVNPLFYSIGIFTGGVMTYCLAKLCPFFSYIGKRTIPILALHPLCFKIVSLIQWKLYDGDFIVLSLYPVWTIKPVFLWSFICLILGVGIPLIISFLLSKTKIGKTCFKCS